MSQAFITPIQLPQSFTGIRGIQAEQTNTGNGSLFKDIFQNAVNNVTDTQKTLSQQQYLLSTGQIDDAHTVPIAASEAQLSVELLVQLRNKSLEAYNELMRIGV